MDYFEITTSQISFHATADQVRTAILKDIENRIYRGLKTDYIIVDERFAWGYKELIDQEAMSKDSKEFTLHYQQYYEQWPFKGKKFYDYEVIECETLEIKIPLGKVTVWWILG